MNESPHRNTSAARAARLHRESVVADTHNDLLMAVVERPPWQWGEFFAERWLPQLRDGGVNIQVLPVFVDEQFRPEGALRHTLRMIEAAHRAAEHSPDDVELCIDGAQLRAALAAGKIALVLALEGCPGIDADPELVTTMYRLGVRIVSFVQYGRTALADGSDEDAAGSRLTSRGVEALAEMQRLGVLADVSHLGAAGVEHVLEISRRPIMATHSSARALRDHHRNLTDGQLRGIAATGGVTCVNFYPPFLATDGAATIDTLTDHIEHVADVAGVDHVGLGPDFMHEVVGELTPAWRAGAVGPNGWDVRDPLPGVPGPGALPRVTEALAARGLPDEAIGKILGGNVRRLFDTELGFAAPAHRNAGAAGRA